MAGLYCCWSIKTSKNGFYVSAINAKYINEFYREYGKLTLLSTAVNCAPLDSDVFISNEICESITLPYFKNYLASIVYFPKILRSIILLCKKEKKIYIRTPEPLSWFFLFFKKDRIINYHFVSNPIEVIWENKSKSIINRCLKLTLYYPEYLLTCITASLCKSTANGESVLKNIPNFLKKKTLVLIESSLTDDDFKSKKELSNICSLELKFLCVSRLVEGKGLEILIRSFHKIKKTHPEKSFKLNIVGSGPLKIKLRNLIKELALEDNILLLGEIKNGTNLNNIYLSNDIFINPSLSETGPRVLLEAMSQSLFCISTDVGYAKYVMSIDDVECGLIIPPNSEDDLINAILWSYENVHIWIKKSMLAQQYSTHFTLNNFVKSIFN